MFAYQLKIYIILYFVKHVPKQHWANICFIKEVANGGPLTIHKYVMPKKETKLHIYDGNCLLAVNVFKDIPWPASNSVRCVKSC